MVQEQLVERSSFYKKMEGLLNVQPGTIHGSQTLSSIKNWDSLTILEFIVLVDQDYRADVQPADIVSCKTVDDLAELILSRA